jgi:hypothetical protein
VRWKDLNRRAREGVLSTEQMKTREFETVDGPWSLVLVLEGKKESTINLYKERCVIRGKESNVQRLILSLSWVTTMIS